MKLMMTHNLIDSYSYISDVAWSDEGQNYTPNSSIKQNHLIYLLYAENIQKHCKWLTEL